MHYHKIDTKESDRIQRKVHVCAVRTAASEKVRLGH